ncbi:MAG: thioesterase family protein [Alphaproteobacteria bacterium]
MADSTAQSEFFFDQETAVEKLADGRFRAQFHDRWAIGAGTPNGGYLMAIATRALAGTLDHPHPLSVTGHYMGRSQIGPVEIETEKLGRSLTTSTGFARLIQDGKQRTHFTATFTDFDMATGQSVVDAVPPDLPPPDQCVELPRPDGVPSFQRKIEMRFHPDHVGWLQRTPHGVGEMAGYIRFGDDHPADFYSVLLFADAVPPAIFNVVGPTGWVPTIELTTHLRSMPAPGWLRFRFTTKFLTRGFFEEDGEIWDSEDRLIADSRQIQKLMAPKKKD